MRGGMSIQTTKEKALIGNVRIIRAVNICTATKRIMRVYTQFDSFSSLL